MGREVDYRVRSAYAGLLIVAGVALRFNAVVLATLGGAGGFRIVSQVGILSGSVGFGILVSLLLNGSSDINTSHLGYVVPAIVFPVGLVDIEGPILDVLSLTLLFWPSSIWIVRRLDRSVLSLRTVVTVTSISWLGAVGLTVSSQPRGPIGLYLLSHVTLVSAITIVARQAWSLPIYCSDNDSWPP